MDLVACKFEAIRQQVAGVCSFIRESKKERMFYLMQLYSHNLSCSDGSTAALQKLLNYYDCVIFFFKLNVSVSSKHVGFYLHGKPTVAYFSTVHQ